MTCSGETMWVLVSVHGGVRILSAKPGAHEANPLADSSESTFG